MKRGWKEKELKRDYYGKNLDVKIEKRKRKSRNQKKK